MCFGNVKIDIHETWYPIDNILLMPSLRKQLYNHKVFPSCIPPLRRFIIPFRKTHELRSLEKGKQTISLAVYHFYISCTIIKERY